MNPDTVRPPSRSSPRAGDASYTFFSGDDDGKTMDDGSATDDRSAEAGGSATDGSSAVDGRPGSGGPTPVRWANLAVRFGLELTALSALAYWGVRTGEDTLARAVLGLGAPLLAAVVWGLFAAPKARYRLSDEPRLLVGLAVFGVAAIAFVAAGLRTVGIVYAVVAAVNSVWVYLNGDL